MVSVSAMTVHPEYSGIRGAAINDLAVLTLAEPVTGVDPIELPGAGFLDRSAARNGLTNHTFTNVGYGAVPSQTGPWWTWTVLDDGIRRVSTSPFQGLTQHWLNLNMNTNATGEGGVCINDSGSPKFFEAAGGENGNLAVAITTAIDPRCRTTNSNERLDTASARDFLGEFVTLP